MTYSRRNFMKWAGSLSAFAVMEPTRTRLVPFLGPTFGTGYKPDLMPSQKEMWDDMKWMAALGPKYTGNKAHTTYVNWAASKMQELGLEIQRDQYKLPLWEAKRWELSVKKPNGDVIKPKLTYYFPYSKETSPQGVSGKLEYVGTYPNFFNMNKLKGKIAVVDFVSATREWQMMYKQWGVFPKDARFPDTYRPARAAMTDLSQFAKAGAVGVIICWTDVSDANATDQHSPFGFPFQEVPGLYVGRKTGMELSALASEGAIGTIVLEATIAQDTPTESIIGTLRGSSSEEAMVVNTHSDGPNAIEENGPNALVALAKYFKKIPKSELRRDIVFPISSGHFARPWVPDTAGFFDKHPDLIKRTVAAITVEHLGCKEYIDDASMTNYHPSGENQWNVTVTNHQSLADLAMESLEGSSAVKRTGIVKPLHSNGWFGVGTPFGMAGIPTMQYIPQPNYLLVGTADGCIDKISPELFRSQVEFFAKIVLRTNGMTAEQIRGNRKIEPFEG